MRKTAPGKPMPRGARQPVGRAATAEQLRQQRLMLDQQRRQREARWWVINQNALKDLHTRQHHAAGGEAIGTVLNADRRMRWRTSHAVGAITLLILSFFFTSMAIGAQSIGIAVLAFLCLAGCIGFFTVEHSKRRFPQPVPAPPLIGQHRIEDLIEEDDAPRAATVKEAVPATIDALGDMFEPASLPESAQKAAGAPQTAPVGGPAKPATAEAAVVEPVAVVAAEAVAEPADEPKATIAAETPPVVTEPVSEAITVEDEPEPLAAAVGDAGPPTGDGPSTVAFSLPTDQVGGDAAATGTATAPARPAAAPAKGRIAEAVTRLKAPPRQRDTTEGRSLAHDLAELLLSEERLGGADVTDVAATLVVGDLQRSIEFYTDALGLTVADRTEEAAVLDAGFGKILLWERPDAPPGETGVMHLTFEVGDIDSTFAKMNQAGVEFLHLPRTALLGQHYEMRAAAFRDPDGHGLAITEHRERD
ncbi:VOC family protein [Glycomyces sp. TRM65418]|uniref:VOC family protein n=1 Tax=Glycomyces sp. TRM65418 TaxID=2867006 RepID=UPI001CE5F432|nr:VOC family protein [Glycomyces sp. TRM65418]MCC3765713.1 VOC family protein [Glycomyces sp. TRM65418]QZD55305.1 VOC family protein [Glycomyces sp. TRM65418]